MRFTIRYFLPTLLGLVFAGSAHSALAQRTITCSSDDGGRHYCHLDARGGVEMTNQRSSAACQQGYSWGYDRDGIWVDHGCRADFTINSSRRGFGGDGGQMITCSSDDGGRHTCSADTRGGVQMTNQRSGAACQQGYSWGYDQNGIWVDHGCRADFMVNSYNSYNNGYNRGGQSITCSSDDGGRHYCGADTSNGVQLARQRSDARCEQGYSWGYDQRGVWVDHGCRADFTTGTGFAGGQTITCASDDGGRHHCPADTRGGVEMTHQRSDARCVQWSTWGYDQTGIWVDHGCRADFITR